MATHTHNLLLLTIAEVAHICAKGRYPGASRQVHTCPPSRVGWSSVASGDRAGGSLDQVDDDGMRRAAGADPGTVCPISRCTGFALHGQPGWVSSLTPLSVDEMIVAASATLLAESRAGRRGAVLPWALLVAGSVASSAANVTAAEPTLSGRVIAA